jgi:L-alanine-DL-glutamate epimerase-like enolase superfamily enzyme
MKIAAFEIIPVSIPMEFNYMDTAALSAGLVRLTTDDGLTGVGHAVPLSNRHVRSLLAAMQELAELLIGEDPRGPERVHRKLLPDGTGPGGPVNLAAAALDVAVWDLAAKAAGQPLYRLLGGSRNRVPVYASLRLGRAIPTEQLPGLAEDLVKQGFRAMKTNLGGPWAMEEDLRRVRAVRKAIGPDIGLLADVNFRWTVAESIRMGQELEELDLFWLEDPVPTHNVEGLAEVRKALKTPIAAGEALYNLPAFRTLFEARSVDFPMPDLARVGGITPYLKIAHMAEAFGLPLACHLQPELSVHVVAGVPNGRIVEYVPWGWQITRGAPELKDGELLLSERSGHGMEIDEDFVAAHRLN